MCRRMTFSFKDLNKIYILMKSITLIQIDTEGNMSTLVINGNSVGFFSLLDQPKYLYITYIDYNFIKLVDKNCICF